MNRRRYLNYISTLNTLQDTSINFRKLIPTAVYSNSKPHNNKNLIGDININITLPSGFVAQNTEAPFDRSIRQEPISEVFEQQNIPDEAPTTQQETIPATQDITLQRVDENVILDTPENRNIIFEEEKLRRQMERARLLREREERSIARRQRNAEAENRRRASIDPDNELIVPILQTVNDPTESEIEFHRDRLQGLQGNLQSPEINISQQMLTLGGFTSGSESDSGNNSSSSVRSYNSIIPNPDITLDSETGSTYLRNYNWSTPTRPNTPNPNPTSLQGIGLEPILQRDYFDTRNIT